MRICYKISDKNRIMKEEQNNELTELNEEVWLPKNIRKWVMNLCFAIAVVIACVSAYYNAQINVSARSFHALESLKDVISTCLDLFLAVLLFKVLKGISLSLNILLKANVIFTSIAALITLVVLLFSNLNIFMMAMLPLLLFLVISILLGFRLIQMFRKKLRLFGFVLMLYPVLSIFVGCLIVISPLMQVVAVCVNFVLDIVYYYIYTHLFEERKD